MSSDYERERLENIRRNEELMRELDVLGGSKAVGAVPKPKPAPRPAKRAVKPVRVKSEVPVATRSSARLKGHVADSETYKRKLEEEAEEVRQAQEAAKRAKHEDHDLEELTGGVLGADELEDLRQSLRNARAVKDEDADTKHTFSAESKELSRLLGNMQLRSVAKVTPARIYSAMYHPTREKDLVFFGDKEGGIGVWDAAADVGASEDTMPEGKSWTLQAHGKSPVTCLKIDPIATNTLYSASYDATIRCLDLVTSTSREIWAERDETLLSIFDILTPDSHPGHVSASPANGLDSRSLWIADHRGGLLHLDLREQKSNMKARRWQVCEKKIGAMSVNPAAPHCIATGSLDQHVRLFDVRALQTLKTTNTAPYNYKAVDAGDLSKVYEKAQIGAYKATKACTSVDFSPTGQKLIGVTYDDKLKVWDTDPTNLQAAGKVASPKKGVDKTAALAKEVTITHNNQSGKWITILRAKWNRNPTLAPHFSIGGMNRRAEIFSADGTLLRALYDEDYVTAVPAVTAMHPSLPGHLVTGNASGRCTLWS